MEISFIFSKREYCVKLAHIHSKVAGAIKVDKLQQHFLGLVSAPTSNERVIRIQQTDSIFSWLAFAFACHEILVLVIREDSSRLLFCSFLSLFLFLSLSLSLTLTLSLCRYVSLSFSFSYSVAESLLFLIYLFVSVSISPFLSLCSIFVPLFLSLSLSLNVFLSFLLLISLSISFFLSLSL